MIIKSIELSNFRSYKEVKLEFSEGVNILYGNNAQGKTNILEAIYLCSTTKSHRTAFDKELIKFKEEEAHVKVFISKKNIDNKIDIHLKALKKKGIALNGIPVKKASEIFGLLNVVLFSPEDLNLVKEGPRERRNFIDMQLCQLDKIYYYNLYNYNKILLQRNNLLKQIEFRKDLIGTLDIWDEQLVKFGIEIIKSRQKFIKELNEIVIKVHNDISGEIEKINIEYEPSILIEGYYEAILKNREKDLKLKTTTVGIHRDDLKINIDNIDIRKYGSQGQQRTAALSLKLSQINIIEEVIGEKPVLLLDDVLSELDSNRQNHLLNKIIDIQTIITCTGIDEFIKNRLSIDKIFKVHNSTICLDND